MLSDKDQITRSDVDALTDKLSDFARTLNEKEQKALTGVLELAGKMYEGTGSGAVGKRKLNLERETVRDLNVWDRLLETQGWSLWTCDKPGMPGEEIINPP